MVIRSQQDLEQAALNYGILPFFRNNIKGFSVEEMTPPALLFGGNEYEGCWEWKGPVVRRHTTAYGKFFRRKAGYVSRELLPYFLSMRRASYPIKPGSTEEMIHDIISINDAMSSTDLRQCLLGAQRRRTAYDLPEAPDILSPRLQPTVKRPSRHSLEAPLQRLQMGGWLCISDFRYKLTRSGERYGWGVAEYSSPEMLFPPEAISIDLSPSQCMEIIVDFVGNRYRNASGSQLIKLLS